MSYTYFATCPFGLENILEQELINLEIDRTSLNKGGVAFECSDEKVVQAILHLKTASRILHKMLSSEIKNFEDVYQASLNFPWHKIFHNQDSFKVKTVVSQKDLKLNEDWKNSFLFNQKFKDGYVDRFRKETKIRPSVDKQNPKINFHLFIENSYLTVYVDLCGKPLSDRGYRGKNFVAPLRENLAAGIVKTMNINFQEETFLEAMCGSGTVLIEAIYEALGIPASFAYWKQLNLGHRLWNFQQTEAFKQRFTLKRLPIDSVVDKIQKNTIKFYGNDWEKRALELTEQNLRFIGIDKCVHLSRQNATQLKPPADKSTIFINPPYAKRLGEEQGLEKLYYDFGENLKHEFKNSRAFILTGNFSLLKKISLRTSKKHILFNGPIECRLAEYQLY